MPVTDPGVAALGHPERIAGLIGDEGIEVVFYERSRVEPTLGGGSAMDTAKVADSAGPTAPCPSATTGSELVAGTLSSSVAGHRPEGALTGRSRGDRARVHAQLVRRPARGPSSRSAQRGAREPDAARSLSIQRQMTSTA